MLFITTDYLAFITTGYSQACPLAEVTVSIPRPLV
jgi:hypothetical protein